MNLGFLWRLLDWYRDYRLERLRLVTQAQQAPFVALETIVGKALVANGESTQLLKTWLESFTAKSDTGTTTIRDDDEVRMELERLGFENPALHETINTALRSGNIAEFKEIIRDF